MKNTHIKAGVMGWPIHHSLSPRLHSYWLEHYGIQGSYEALPVEPAHLARNLRDAAAAHYQGVNLTVPHKETALAMMDIVDPLAQRVGAVNTVIVHADGRLEGRNTDVFGFSTNITEGGYRYDGRPVTMLGAGGASRAALVALMDVGVTTIRIVNRTPERGEELRQQFSPKAIETYRWDDPKALAGSGLLVNATSLGLKGQPPLIINLDNLPHDAYVTDMVYAPLLTGLLTAAKTRGNPVIDGLGMLLHQARPAFQSFFGMDPAVTPALRQHVMQGLSS